MGKETRCIEDEIPFEIPQNWSWIRLGGIGIWGSGSTPSRSIKAYYNGNIPWLKTGDLNDGYIENTSEYITNLAFQESSLKLNPVGSVLIAMYGATIGKLGILKIQATTNQACCACEVFNGILNKYIFYFLMFYKKIFISISEGGAQPNISKEKIVTTLLPLPPLSEQKRIVDKLEEILPLVEKYKEDKEKLDELNLNFPSKLKKSILDYAIKGKLVEQNLEDESVEILLQKIREEKQRLVKDKKLKADKFPQSTIFIGEDNSPYEKIGKETRCIEDEIPFEIPSSWAWVRLGEICQIYTGDSINQTQKLTKYANLEDGRYYIATKDVSFDGSIDYENGVKIPFNESRFKIAPKNSVLLCVEGGSAGKKIGYLDCDVCFGNKLCCFNPLLIEPKFIYYYLQSQIFIYSFMQKMSGIISGISLNSIKTIVIAIPPLPEQKRIVEKIELLLPLLKP